MVLKSPRMPMFTQGEIIVRDDLKYPDGAFVVVGLDKFGRLLVQPLGGLGQLALGRRDVARVQSIEPADTIELGDVGSANVHFLGAGSWMWENTEPSQGSGRLHQ